MNPGAVRPASDRAGGAAALDRIAPAASGFDGCAPAGRDEAGREVGERRQDEEALSGESMWNDEVGGLGRIARPGLGRALDVNPVPAEDEEVEIELPWPPALPLLASGHGLQPLEGYEERERAARGIGAERDIDRDRGVPELWLVKDTHRLGGIQPRD